MALIVGAPNSMIRTRRGQGQIYIPDAPTGPWAFWNNPPPPTNDSSYGCLSGPTPQSLFADASNITINEYPWTLRFIPYQALERTAWSGETQEFSIEMKNTEIFTTYFAGSTYGATLGIYMELRYGSGAPSETLYVQNVYSTSAPYNDVMLNQTRFPPPLTIKMTRADVNDVRFFFIVNCSCFNQNGYIDYEFDAPCKVTEPTPNSNWRILVESDNGAGFAGVSEVVWTDTAPIIQSSYTQTSSASASGFPPADSADGNPATSWKSATAPHPNTPVNLDSTLQNAANISSVDITATLDSGGTDAPLSFFIQKQSHTGLWETTSQHSATGWTAGETRTFKCG
tara:strand:- start:1890 stop:2912 length:1023 start_codon:yes stop_codon:yes gene_type:complete